MGAKLQLGTIAGVSVGLHWSALGTIVLLFGIVTAGFSNTYPDQSAFTHVVAGLLAAVLFMASLLAHEVAHAVVAKRNGLEVEDITLWLLGGVSRIKGEAPRPGVDFAIAIIGPAVSLATAAAFGVLAWLLALASVGALWVEVASYLALINALIAAFNLIPAAPLDGGRVLRAALWALRGDRTSAAVWAARMGRGFGMMLLTLGVLGFLFGYGGGLWWFLIGMFVLVMAGAEERQAQTSAALTGLRVRDVMTQDPDTAPGDIDVEAFLHETALLRRHSAFPLLDGEGRLEGLITFNRLKAVPADKRATTTLREAACPPAEVPIADPDESLTDLLPRLSAGTDGRALVFSDGRLVGIVSPSDISRAVALRLLGG